MTVPREKTPLSWLKKMKEERIWKTFYFVVGSLRKGSFNHQMAEKAERILEGKATVTYLDYSNLPLMNQT